MMPFGERLALAVDYARLAHSLQVRKGSGIPYLYHPLAVASLVIEFGGNEDQVIAGLLHDVIEDCGAAHEAVIRARFGDAVADIVVACTDASAEGKAVHVDPLAKKRDWITRKQAYLAHLETASDSTLLVSGCDKLHNARAIVQDMESNGLGVGVFDRFTGGRDGTLFYYAALAVIIENRHVPVAPTLRATVTRMMELAGVDEKMLVMPVDGVGNF